MTEDESKLTLKQYLAGSTFAGYLKGHLVPRRSNVAFLLNGNVQPASNMTFLLERHLGQPG